MCTVGGSLPANLAFWRFKFGDYRVHWSRQGLCSNEIITVISNDVIFIQMWQRSVISVTFQPQQPCQLSSLSSSRPLKVVTWRLFSHDLLVISQEL